MVFLVFVREYIDVLDVVNVLGVNVRFLLRVNGFGFLDVNGCFVNDEGVFDLLKSFLEKGDKEDDMLCMFFLYNVDECLRFTTCLWELLLLLLLFVFVFVLLLVVEFMFVDLLMLLLLCLRCLNLLL